jgi:hypothetical protein
MIAKIEAILLTVVLVVALVVIFFDLTWWRP